VLGILQEPEAPVATVLFRAVVAAAAARASTAARRGLAEMAQMESSK
jgi:hypothetical protein